MRTVSSKLTKEEHEKLLELCNQEGQSVSEFLRDLITDVCDSYEKPEPEEDTSPKLVTNAKIIAIDGVPVREISS